MEDTHIISTLNDLIETCKDGEFGFRGTAEYARSPSLQQVFLRRAQEYRLSAQELRELVVQFGGDSPDSGTWAGAAHRGWLAIKEMLTSYSELKLLEEAEQGEESAIVRYREALVKDLPPDVRAIVQRQFDDVERSHLQLREQRDQLRIQQHVS